MAKISITRPQSTGTFLYGSLRSHSSFVSISINLGNGGDHVMDDSGDDTGFKGAHESVMKRRVPVYDKSKPSFSFKDERDPKTGLYERGSLVGWKNLDAPEVEEHRREVIEVNLSFEQFAELLSSTGHQVDCTISSFAPVGEEGAHYIEEVVPPPSIYDRAKRRIANTQRDALEEIEAGIAEIDEMKATNKVKDAMRHRLEMTRQHLRSNAGFVISQATEEMSSIAESANVLILDKLNELVAQGKLSKDAISLFHAEPSMLPAPEEE